ncbi:MAG: aconitate hydratase AcnA [Desulfobacteraceae bacterium]|nr:MAG: aconitate hydratase AcnA [Desulfobacteraceae bacterium]
MEKKEFERQIEVDGKSYRIYDIRLLEEKGIADVKSLPFSIRILVENLLRKLDGRVVTEEDLKKIARWKKSYDEPVEIPFHPARALTQDLTGVPSVVDLAAMRDAVKAQGGDPRKINPLVPVDLIVDHSVQVDYFGTENAVDKNTAKEYERNGERYALLKWAQKSFTNLRVVPPKAGICHQVNLENLGQTVLSEEKDGIPVAFPDTLVGMDSHTTMINGIGVLGWGVGGIEAEAVMLGQPYYMTIPEVVGIRLTGRLKAGVTATDLVLRITEMLRKKGVVDKFVEYFGPGMKNLSIPDRATISNMTPEAGATLSLFPVDEKTLQYLRLTQRQEAADLTEAYTRRVGLFYTGKEIPEYSEVIELDLKSIEPALAGPARPQDRIDLTDLKSRFAEILGCEYKRDTDVRQMSTLFAESGTETTRSRRCVPVSPTLHEIDLNGTEEKIGDGSIVIAAITSCTNTSNPYVLLGAGLVAKRAVRKGLRVPPCVKTSLAPGSRVVMDYLDDAGLTPYLSALGFHLAGFGCTTCIGNSGPLHPEIEHVIAEHDLNVAAVLSGNRNFEARIHQSVRSNFLASPMLVVVFALAGRIDIDLTSEPVGLDPNGEPVYLDEIWPSDKEIQSLVRKHVKGRFFKTEYGRILEGDDNWKNMEVAESTTFQWDPQSTYIKNPPYFEGFSPELPGAVRIENAKVLAFLGDSVTTDHISPAGAIAEAYPSGQYLKEKGVSPAQFNSYGARRGNHEVMMRGSFGNIRIKNRLVAPREGSFTKKFPEGKEIFIYDAAMEYKKEGRPLVVLGGKEYGSGSSRDWAAKGTQLLGAKAVIVKSFERIHRSNLVGMGVLPLMLKPQDNWEKLGIDGTETFTIGGLESITPRATLPVKARKQDGAEIDFEVIARLDTEIEIDYFRHGGIMPYVLRKLMKE